MNIQLTIKEKTATAIIAVDTAGHEYTLPLEILPQAVVGDTCWLAISKSELKTTDSKEILNELLH